MELSVEVWPADRWPECKPIWSLIADQSANTSFFLRPAWVESWLEHCAAALNVEILIFRAGAEPAGICLLVSTSVWRGPVRLRRIYLNTAGEAEEDGTCIEFNNLLCLDGMEKAMARSLAAYLASKKWHELALSGFVVGPVLETLIGVFDGCVAVHRVRSSPYVDLDVVRGSGGSYEDLLGHPTRKHLRQNYRNYSRHGPLTTQAAGSTEEALQMIDELADLHTRSWNRRGLPGVFRSKTFRNFHQALIRRVFPTGNVQVIRAAAGDTIGLVYGFIDDGRFYFYQSGLHYAKDNRSSPGLVTNACAVKYCLASGLKRYEFLAGNSQYKKSLATNSCDLDWCVLQRKSLRIDALNYLLALKRRYPIPGMFAQAVRAVKAVARLVVGSREVRRKTLYRARLKLKGIDVTGVTTNELGLNENRSAEYSDSGFLVGESFSGPDAIPCGRAVLDVGCGKGGAMLALRRYFERVDGVELSPELVAIARRNLKRQCKHCQVFCCDAAEFDGYGNYDTFYFYNPFPAPVMRTVVRRIFEAAPHGRIIYVNPKHGDVVLEFGYKEISRLALRHDVAVYRLAENPAKETPSC